MSEKHPAITWLEKRVGRSLDSDNSSPEKEEKEEKEHHSPKRCKEDAALMEAMVVPHAQVSFCVSNKIRMNVAETRQKPVLFRTKSCC